LLETCANSIFAEQYRLLKEGICTQGTYTGKVVVDKEEVTAYLVVFGEGVTFEGVSRSFK